MEKKLRLLLFILICYSGSAAFAQQRQLSGTVIDAEDGKS